MIQVYIIYDKEKKPFGFRMEGHAGYAQAGYDIICSAVSSLTWNMINSMEAYTGTGFRYEAKEDGGLLKFRFMESPDQDSCLLFQSMLLGLKAVQEQYGTAYLQITCLRRLENHRFTRINYQEV